MPSGTRRIGETGTWGAEPLTCWAEARFEKEKPGEGKLFSWEALATWNQKDAFSQILFFSLITGLCLSKFNLYPRAFLPHHCHSAVMERRDLSQSNHFWLLCSERVETQSHLACVLATLGGRSVQKSQLHESAGHLKTWRRSQHIGSKSVFGVEVLISSYAYLSCQRKGS